MSQHLTHEQRKNRRKGMSIEVNMGKSPREVACEYGVTIDTVYSACKENGVTVLTSSGNGNKLHDSYGTMVILAKMLYTDNTLKSISDQYKVSRQRVSEIYRAARKAGIKVPVRLRGRQGGWR